jgi:hypothetical protein
MTCESEWNGSWKPEGIFVERSMHPVPDEGIPNRCVLPGSHVTPLGLHPGVREEHGCCGAVGNGFWKTRLLAAIALSLMGFFAAGSLAEARETASVSGPADPGGRGHGVAVDGVSSSSASGHASVTLLFPTVRVGGPSVFDGTGLV